MECCARRATRASLPAEGAVAGRNGRERGTGDSGRTDTDFSS